jgi:hypothetical protein
LITISDDHRTVLLLVFVDVDVPAVVVSDSLLLLLLLSTIFLSPLSSRTSSSSSSSSSSIKSICSEGREEFILVDLLLMLLSVECVDNGDEESSNEYDNEHVESVEADNDADDVSASRTTGDDSTSANTGDASSVSASTLMLSSLIFFALVPVLNLEPSSLS